MIHATEDVHSRAKGLDRLADEQILQILHEGQVAAAQAVQSAIPDIARGADAMAQAIRSGGNLIYGAAGSSGLMGLADGIEIHPTFGIPIPQIKILRAGGLDDIQTPKGQLEDDVEAALRDGDIIRAEDCVIALAASGNTPYPVEMLKIARERGAASIGISNNPDTQILAHAEIAILLPTPPEVIAGSTRLGAGTAQKMALNMMSTLMGVKLGHVLDGLMVNVVANNEKLFDRAERIVKQVTGCDQQAAQTALRTADGEVKPAILLVLGVGTLEAARSMLNDSQQNLRDAIERVKAG